MNSHIKENNYKLCSWDCVHVPAHTSEYPCDKNGPILTHLSLLTTPQPSSHSSHTPHLHFPHSPTFPSLLTHPIPPHFNTPHIHSHTPQSSPHSSHTPHLHFPHTPHLPHTSNPVTLTPQTPHTSTLHTSTPHTPTFPSLLTYPTPPLLIHPTPLHSSDGCDE